MSTKWQKKKKERKLYNSWKTEFQSIMLKITWTVPSIPPPWVHTHTHTHVHTHTLTLAHTNTPTSSCLSNATQSRELWPNLLPLSLSVVWYQERRKYKIAFYTADRTTCTPFPDLFLSDKIFISGAPVCIERLLQNSWQHSFTPRNCGAAIHCLLRLPR